MVGMALRAGPYFFCLAAVIAAVCLAERFGTARRAIPTLFSTPLPQRELSSSPPLELSPAPFLPLPALAVNEPPAVPPEPMPDSPDRVADARARRGAGLVQLFAAAGVSYPARGGVYLRVFKYEGELELWARSDPAADAPFRLVHTYPVLCASGRLGPKRREGDGQVPEGFYHVDRFNPRSLFHLSLGLNYPNAADRALTTDPEHPGTDIFIHGNALSVGCLAMGDAVAEELYLAVADARAAGVADLPVHLFPCRMNEANWRELLAPLCTGRPEIATLWISLRAGYDHFEHTHRLPAVRVDATGRHGPD